MAARVVTTEIMLHDGKHKQTLQTEYQWRDGTISEGVWILVDRPRVKTPRVQLVRLERYPLLTTLGGFYWRWCPAFHTRKEALTALTALLKHKQHTAMERHWQALEDCLRYGDLIVRAESQRSAEADGLPKCT